MTCGHEETPTHNGERGGFVSTRDPEGLGEQAGDGVDEAVDAGLEEIHDGGGELSDGIDHVMSFLEK